MKRVNITMEGYGLFSRHCWAGKIVKGLVILDPGFRKDIFIDKQPISFYKCNPLSAASARKIEEIK
jgi:hypothetical protein